MEPTPNPYALWSVPRTTTQRLSRYWIEPLVDFPGGGTVT
jgi:hypothetical protein